jgi:putative transposase
MRDKLAAKRFFKRVLAACPEAPRRIVACKLLSYPAAKAEIAQLATDQQVFLSANARVNQPCRAQPSTHP